MIRMPLAALAAALLAFSAHGQAIETAARHALLIDDATGTVMLEKAADVPMPPSSMSKMMTVHMVFDLLKQGKLKMSDELGVSERAWRMQGSKMWVDINTRVRVEDLLRGVIVQSGNDACIVLAEGLAGSEEAFAEQMNQKAKQMGLTASVFRNSTGWPEKGHVMTARDLALLAQHTIREFPDYYKMYAEKDFTWHKIKQGNRNPLLYKNFGADGLKTGHTEEAGYGLTASAVRDGRRLILVLNGLSSMNERARESERLLDWGFREFANYALFKQGETVEEAHVWLGQAATVPLVADRDILITLSRKARQGMKASIVYDGPIKAPIAKGAQFGKLVVNAPDNKTVEIPLVAGADVEALGGPGRLLAAFKYLVFGKSKT
jgi:serine-type D-Ala-D-Ala carboxypeptidase (penicillin-binding protein 5/6)